MSVCVWSSSCSYICVYIWRVKVSLGYCFPRGDHFSFGDKVSLSGTWGLSVQQGLLTFKPQNLPSHFQITMRAYGCWGSNSGPYTCTEDISPTPWSTWLQHLPVVDRRLSLSSFFLGAPRPQRLNSSHFPSVLWHFQNVIAPEEEAVRSPSTCKILRKHCHVDGKFHSVLCLLCRNPQDAKRQMHFSLPNYSSYKC